MTNTTTSESTFSSKFNKLSETQVIIITMMFCSSGIFGIMGNSLVIYLYSKNCKTKLYKLKRLMLFLGVADLVTSIMNPFYYVYLLTNTSNAWHFGIIGCKVIPTLGQISTRVSEGLLLIIALDRDRAVVTPCKKQYTTKTIYLAVCLNVILSTATFIPFFLNHHLIKGNCELNMPYYYTPFSLTQYLVNDVLCFSIFISTFLRMASQLEINRFTSARRKCTGTRKRSKEGKKILKMLLLLFLCFAISIFPLDVFLITLYFQKYFGYQIHQSLLIFYITKFLSTTNSCINVIVYSLLNSNFRRNTRRVFRLRSLNLSYDTSTNNQQSENNM